MFNRVFSENAYPSHMVSQYWAQFLKDLIEKILSIQKTWFTDFFCTFHVTLEKCSSFHNSVLLPFLLEDLLRKINSSLFLRSFDIA